jgi:hypothetical protein
MAECTVREGMLREFIFDDLEDEEDSASTPTEPNYCYIVTCILIKFVEILVQWLRYCVTNRKVAGSIPDGVTGIFH